MHASSSRRFLSRTPSTRRAASPSALAVALLFALPACESMSGDEDTGTAAERAVSSARTRVKVCEVDLEKAMRDLEGGHATQTDIEEKTNALNEAKQALADAEAKLAAARSETTKS